MQYFRSINRWQSLEVFLYGIDAWRKATFDDGIEIVGRCNDAHVGVKFPTERVDFIATYLCETIACIFTASLFRPAQHGIIPERIVRTEIGFYLAVLGGVSPAFGRIASCFHSAFICFIFHCLPVLVSKSEVTARMSMFQAI